MLFDCVKANTPLWRWVSGFLERRIQPQNVCQHMPMIFGGAYKAVFPLPHRPRRNPCFYRHFGLCKIGFDALQQEVISCGFRIDGNELSRAKSAVRKLANDTDCPLCNSQQCPQPPLALSVPLSRFTPRVGGGSA